MTLRPTTGWLPVDIGFDPQAVVVQEALVRWMEFGATPLADPFFDHTVDRLRTATPPAREIETDLDTMVRLTRLNTIRPAGFIFHLSHCGSTLIANALKTCDRAVVVSESRAVTKLLRSRTQGLSPYLSERWDLTRRTLLNALFSLFAHYQRGEPQPLVLKFVSLDILSMSVMRSYWPKVPCIVVIRDPVEIMVTILKGRGWLTFKDHPNLAAEVFGWKDLPRSSKEMVPEEFCARVLNSLCASALQALDDKCKVLDYVDLRPNTAHEIAAFFGIDLPDEGRALELVFNSYAKDPEKTVRFRDDRERKQKLATVLVRSAANRWAMESYSELRRWKRPEGSS
jgi:hypothetical protein